MNELRAMNAAEGPFNVADAERLVAGLDNVAARIEELEGGGYEAEREEAPPRTTSVPSSSKADPKAKGRPDPRTAPSEAPDLLPTKIDAIPEVRLSPSNKSAAALVDDIRYFLKNFPKALKSEKASFAKISKTSVPLLTRLHAKIVGKLKPSGPEGAGKKVGIVLDGKAYIASEVRKLMMGSDMRNLRPGDMVIDVADDPLKPKDGDVGGWDVKKSHSGGVAAQREAIYRAMPSENPEAEPKKRKKGRGIQMLPSAERNLMTASNRMARNNPFQRERKTMRLKFVR